MNKGLPGVLLCLVFATLTPAQDKEPAAKPDQKMIQGSWTVVKAERNGSLIPEDIRKQIRVEIDGEVFRIIDSKGEDKAKFRLVQNTTPKGIDFLVGPEQNQVSPGIYRFEDGLLYLCWAKNGQPRPKEFATSEKEKSVLFTLSPAKKQP